MSNWDLSPTGFARVVFITVVGTTVCTVLGLFAVSYTTQFMQDALPRTLSFLAATLLPTFIAGPVFYYFSSRLRDLATAHERLAIVAAQDSLTTCLNRGAFVTLVDAYLGQVNSPKEIYGALLMIDVDHFKSINDSFGHAMGDMALRLIATSIKSLLRKKDLVGRVGGEEFAVLLPHLDEVEANAVAERIRERIATTQFSPDGSATLLSVSIGGVTFQQAMAFDDLLNAADARMYEAKRRGRNRVVFNSAVGALREITTIPRVSTAGQ